MDEMIEDRSKPPPGIEVGCANDESCWCIDFEDFERPTEAEAIAASWTFVDHIRAEARAEAFQEAEAFAKDPLDFASQPPGSYGEPGDPKRMAFTAFGRALTEARAEGERAGYARAADLLSSMRDQQEHCPDLTEDECRAAVMALEVAEAVMRRRACTETLR